MGVIARAVAHAHQRNAKNWMPLSPLGASFKAVAPHLTRVPGIGTNGFVPGTPGCTTTARILLVNPQNSFR